MKEISGYLVAILGLSGEGNTDRITVRDPVETARRLVPPLAKEADVVILPSHAGEETDQKIADTVPGIGVIVAGGIGPVGDPWQSDVTGTVRVRADSASKGHAGRAIGIAELQFDPDGKLEDYGWRRLSLGPEFLNDPEMTAWILEAEKLGIEAQ